MSGIENTFKLEGMSAALEQKAAAALNAIALLIQGTLQQVIRDQGGIYTGAMIGSIAAEPVVFEAGIARLEVGTPFEHATYYEFGTAAHWAPLEPIRQWVEQKLQPHVLAIGVTFEGGRTTSARKGTKVLRGDKREQAIYRVAKAIQKAIALRGTKAHLPMEKTLQMLEIPYQLDAEYIYIVDVVSWLQAKEPGFWNDLANETP